MDQKGIFRSIAQRTGLSREESADVTRAVLEGLATQLSEGEVRHLAVDLPAPLAEEFQAPNRRRPGARPVAALDFIRQVSNRTGLKAEDARAGTGAVLGTLRESLGEEDYRHLLGQLPAEYAMLGQPVS
jgi:uncharacterized protein (DUF2267 family)